MGELDAERIPTPFRDVGRLAPEEQDVALGYRPIREGGHSPGREGAYLGPHLGPGFGGQPRHRADLGVVPAEGRGRVIHGADARLDDQGRARPFGQKYVPHVPIRSNHVGQPARQIAFKDGDQLE